MKQILKGLPLPHVEMRENTMRVEFIYSFDGISQQIASYPFIGSVAKSMDLFLEFSVSELSEIELGKLVKISSCVYFTGKKYWKRPKWYESRRGKFYIDELHPFKIDRGIKELVEEDFIKEFWISNEIKTELILIEE